MSSLLLLGTAREKSTRIPEKMTRPFGNTTLFDIYLKKLEEVAAENHPFDEMIMAVSPLDRVIWEKSRTADVRIVERNQASIEAGGESPASVVLNFLRDFPQQYVFWVNGCFPFLRPETIIAVAKFFRDRRLKGLHCVRARRNWFWDFKKRTPLNFGDEPNVATQNISPLLESVHCLHIYDREYLLNNNRYWPLTPDNPYLYEVEESAEFLDIDTELDFTICERLHQGR